MSTPHDPDHGPDPDREHDPDRERADLDEAFRRIVEGYGERPELGPDDAAPTEPTDPPDTDRLRRLFRTDSPAEASGPTAPPPAQEAWQPDWEGPGFVPPEPPPVPRGTPLRRAAWFGMLGVPALLVVLLLLGMEPPRFVVGCLVAWFLAGSVYLFATMRRSDSDGWDDGAVV